MTPSVQLYYLILAFLSGIVLNVMPCVLPVLTMKVFHMMAHMHDAKRRQQHAVAYTLGVLTLFGIFAGVVVSARAAGHVLQWGMHFQNPHFVAMLTTLVFGFALNAFGVFDINIAWHGGSSSVRDAMGAYLGGVFAAVMSTPCTAPILVTVAGLALASATSSAMTIALFLCMGLGLAFPLLLVSFVGAIAAVIPRPGAWMHTFKQLVGFTLFATSIWLLSVLQQQINTSAATGFLVFLLALAVGLWAAHQWGGITRTPSRRFKVRAMALGWIIWMGTQWLDFTPPTAYACASTAEPHAADPNAPIAWVPFSPDRMAAAHAKGQAVFVDYTAEWCAACKTNEALILDTVRVRQAFIATGVLPMKADLTNEDALIQSWLTKLNRSGIPAYAIYLPDGTIDLLPIVITTDIVAERLNAAAHKP